MGAIVFVPLAQGLLTDRYVHTPAHQVVRATDRPSFDPDMVTDAVQQRLQALHRIANGRGQTLAQLALAWALREPAVASTLIGASSVAQVEENLAALDNLEFTAEELSEIDQYAVESGLDDIWRSSSEL
jgi:L-glyceraldehyde 3-phosphate reductase